MCSWPQADCPTASIPGAACHPWLWTSAPPGQTWSFSPGTAIHNQGSDFRPFLTALTTIKATSFHEPIKERITFRSGNARAAVTLKRGRSRTGVDVALHCQCALLITHQKLTTHAAASSFPHGPGARIQLTSTDSSRRGPSRFQTRCPPATLSNLAAR